MASHVFKTIIFIALVELTLQWCLKTTYNEIGSQILQVDWSPDGQYIVTGSKSNRVTVISTYTSNVVWFDTLSSQVTTTKFSKTGKWLGVGQMGSDTIRIYNVPSFTLNMSFRAEHSSSTNDIFELDFNSDDTKMITCGSDGYVNQRILGNSGTSSLDWQGLIVSGKDVLTCKYSSDNRVGCFCDKQMYLLKTDGTIDEHEAKDIVRDVDFRPGGHKYLYGGCTCDHHLKQYDTNADSITDYFNTKDVIYAVSYASDSSFLVTGGKAGHVYIYNTLNVNTPLQQAYFQQQNINIHSVRVSDDSNFVAVSKASGAIDIYARNCMICPHGYYNNQSACRMCVLDINQCASCKNSTLCYFCFSGYYLNPTNTQCIICRNAMVGCLICKSDTVCLDCTQGYYLTGNNCSTCASLTPLCQQCHNNGTCIKCSYISYLSAPNTCSLCSAAISNCRACYSQYNTSSPTNSTLYCRQCVRGYYASQVQCLPCSSNCLMCANTATCLACAEEYKLSGTTCVKCSQYCEGCNESGTCYQCIPTTFLLSGSCSVCTFPCLTCATSATSCRTCALGYYLNGANCQRCVNCPFCNPISGACISCPIGKYLQTNNCLNCLNTTSHCAICSATACIACERNFYLTGTNTCALSASISDCQVYRKNSVSVCDHCKLGFYLDTTTGTCFKCMNSCSLCDNSTNCTQCQIGYYLISTNLTCAPCTHPCKTCNSSTQCLSCGQQYYLSGTQCLRCWVQIPFCNSCMNSSHCLDCFIGYQVAANSLSCISCVSPCTACNSTGCLSCQLGYFYLSNSCTRCSVGCTSCTSSTNCQQCSSNYVISGNACVLCQSLFPNCLTCSLAGCTTCKPYFNLNPSLGACNSCDINITNCLVCYNGQCQTCIIGNYPASNRLSCVSCSVTMPQCQKCINGSACDECRSGFYLSAVNQCSKCTNGCRICTNSGTCDICDPGFILGAASACFSCSQQIFGCKMCTSVGGCSQCSIQYYLASTTSCLLCRTAMIGCISCTTSSICSSCDSGYFLNSSSKCQLCNISGCSVCNQSTAACNECITGFYLASPSFCSLCSATYSNCAVCNSSQCLRCEIGTYLTSLNSCSSCAMFGQSCIFCNTTHCLQCEAGFYLGPTDSSCQICNIAGCQVCSPTGVGCFSCQNTYYLASSLCSSCSTMDFGCISCSGFNSCLLCKTGYFLQSNGTCSLCSSQYIGCQVCTGLACESCQTNYFQNLTSVSKDCLLCNSFLKGCSLCVDQTLCLVCQSGYYLQNSQCISCTVLNQCLICKDNTTCLFCTEGLYLQNGQCLLCSTAILGCFSCLSSSVCLTCGGSYSMTAAGICQMIKGIPPKNYTQIKVKSFYVNDTCLKHSIYLTGMEFTRIDQQWNSVTTIELIIPPYNKTKLTIFTVNWGRTLPLITLDFYTNNPFGSFSNNNNMPFYSFQNKRVLFSLDELNMGVNFQMKRAALDEILPDLDTNRQDLSIEYFMNEPQFYRSLVKNQRNYYYLFGIAVTTILIFVYFIKIMFLASITTDAGEIIPHILLNKVCAMIIYPTLGGYINYCEGFTYIDFPWLNNYFSQLFSNLSDESPSSYKMFYNNLNIGSTYFLACIVFTVGFVPLYIYATYKNRKKMQGKRIKPRKEESSNDSENSDEKQFLKSINRFQLLTQYIYNIFSAGLIFASFTNLLGMFMNPTNIISISGLFYLLGTLIYVLTILNAVKSFLNEKIKFNRLRVIIKASFMALMYWSPVLLFSALVVIEIGMIMIEYKFKLKEWLVPKAWIICNILNIISYASLIFLSNMIMGLLISSASILLVLFIDGYLIYAQSQQFDKIKKMRNARLDSSGMNFTIEQFEPHQIQSKLQDVKNFYFQQYEKGMSKIRTSSTQISSIQGRDSKISKNSLLKIEEEVSNRFDQKSQNRKTLNQLESQIIDDC